MLRSILFWLIVIVCNAAAFCAAFLVALTTWPIDRRGRWPHLIAAACTRPILTALPGWSFRITGRERIPRDRAAILVANHQSALDLVAVLALFIPCKFVGKQAVVWIPILGWLMFTNRYILLRRGDPTSVRKMWRACQKWLSRGEHVCIFPEGTRAHDDTMLPFRRGAFQLAVETGAVVVPIVIEGTGRALGKGRVRVGSRCALELRVLPSIAPAVAAGSSTRACAEELQERVWQAMHAELAGIRRTQGAGEGSGV